MLMGLFFLLTLYSFIRAQASPRAPVWYGTAVACCLLAVTTKEVAAVAPLLILWYGKLFVVASWRELWQRRWALYAGLAGTWIVLAAVVRSQAEELPKVGLLVVRGVTPLQYAASQPGVITHYLRLSLWPAGLCLDYAWPVADTAAEVVPPLVLIMALLALTACAMVRWPAWSFLGAWFFLILAPTSSIVPIADLAFEHRMYLPLAAVVTGGTIGGYLFGEWLLTRQWPVAVRHSRVLRLIGYGLMGAMAVTLGCLTVRRNSDYHSAASIWGDTVRKSPANAKAHHNLGKALAEEGQLDEAIAEHRKALEIPPDFANAYNNLALLLATCPNALVRDGASAVELAERAVQLARSEDPELLDTLAVAYAEAGRFSQAVQTARRALDLAAHQKKPALTESIKDKMLLYESRTPFREMQSDRDRKG
jgi:protein O-mannosyl-transferase